MDLNISLWGFLTAACYIIIYNFLCKALLMYTGSTSQVSKAVLFINS